MDKYKIIEEITETENSKLYLVRENGGGRVYMMKKIKSGTTSVYERIMDMRNGHIVRVYDVGEDFVVTEYLSGTSLSELGRIPGEYEVCEWTLQLCDAVSRLHAAGIIHRDIKPSNIMLTDDGIIKLIDFDTARTHKSYRSKDTRCMGTDGYAAPEQYGFAQTDVRSDIYSIGAAMLWLVSGGKTPSELEQYNGLLKPVISKCLKLSPKERYQSAEELAAALGGFKPDGKRSDNVNGKFIFAAVLAAAAAVVIVALIAGGVKLLTESDKNKPSEPVGSSEITAVTDVPEHEPTPVITAAPAAAPVSLKVKPQQLINITAASEPVGVSDVSFVNKDNYVFLTGIIHKNSDEIASGIITVSFDIYDDAGKYVCRLKIVTHKPLSLYDQERFSHDLIIQADEAHYKDVPAEKLDKWTYKIAEITEQAAEK